MKLCILTPEPGYEERWQASADQYRRLFGRGIAFRAWNAGADLSKFDLILPLIAWGYQRSPRKWFAALDAWEAAELPFANPIATLRWNTDKDYLLDLEAAGVAIVPTTESGALTNDDLAAARKQFGVERLVIKPAISGGADGTYLLGPTDPIPFDVLEREMLMQPLMPAIASEGEYSLFHFAGQFSHAILKKPAAGDFRVQEQFGGHEVAVVAPAAALALAQAAIAAAPSLPLYARSDMVRGEDGLFRMMELELIEPSLFLEHAPDRGAMFAEAVNLWSI
jgi:glutathione synthase/RimK-type ligase-like ATP-grasp enzyme